MNASDSEVAVDGARRRAGSMVWAPEVRGALCHQLIALACADRMTDPHALEVAARASVVPAALAPVHRQALVSFMVPMAASYLRQARRTGWRFAGSEIVVGDVALDLLWQRRARLEADEVKSSASDPETWRSLARAQAEAQARAGRRHLGAGFAGVRVVALARPDASFWVPA